MKMAKEILIIAMSLMIVFAFGCSTAAPPKKTAAPPKKRHTSVFSKKKADQRRAAERAKQKKREDQQRASDERERRAASKRAADQRAVDRRAAERKRQENIRLAKLEAQRSANAQRQAEERAQEVAVEKKISAEEAYKTNLLAKHPFLAQLSASWDSSALKYIAIDGERFSYEVIKEEIEAGNSIFHLNAKGQLFVNLGKKYEMEFGFHSIGTAGHDDFTEFQIEIFNRDLEAVESKGILNRIDQHSFSR